MLFIVRAFAGYTLGQADIFRKAMGKKIVGAMKKERSNFVKGASKLGFGEEVAGNIFSLIEPFAGYAFNKAHAVSYALVAYQTAYLKANFPVEYMAALLICYLGHNEKLASAFAECRSLGISVLKPDVNASQANFSIETMEGGGKAIRFGLTAIKNVGSGAIQHVIREREENGPFKSVEDLCRRVNLAGVNKRALESLIKAGALDSLGERGTLLNNLSKMLSLSERQQKLKQSGQTTMFDLFGASAEVPLPSLELEPGEAPVKEKLLWEKELMGVYLSEHPFSPYASRASADTDTVLCGQVDEEMENRTVRVAGMVSALRNLTTRDGRASVSARLEDMDGSVEVVAWPKIFDASKQLWAEGNILLVQGRVRARGDSVQIVADSVSTYELNTEPEETTLDTTYPDQTPRQITIYLNQTEDETADQELFNSVVAALKRSPGLDRVSLVINNGSRIYHMEIPDLQVNYTDSLGKKITAIAGTGAVKVTDGRAVG